MAGKTKKTVSVGVVSILSVYIVLMLAVFAVLSYTSSNADYKLSSRAAVSLERYYEADEAAELALAKIAADIQTAGTGWPEALAANGYSPEILTDGALKIHLEQPIDEWRDLIVEALLPLGADGIPTGEIHRRVWKSLPVER